MKEEMLKVLNDESFTTNEEKVDAMAKAMATLVIPKDKFNEESAKRKQAEAELASLSAKATVVQEAPKTESKDDERVIGLQEEIKNLRAESNRAKVEKIFSQAGLEEKDYKEDLDNMDLSDETRALAYANSVVKFLNANTERVKKETQASLLNDTPKPIVGGTNASTATMDKLVEEYGNAVKNKDQIAQARLMRQIQEERAKTSSNVN